MKFKLTRSIDAGGHREWTLEVTRRGLPQRDRQQMAVEYAEKYEMALAAIHAAPSAAEEIAALALDLDEDDAA